MRPKVLVSAYACSPYHGSEAGVGWNYIYHLANHYDVHVIVEKEKWEEEIIRFKAQKSEDLENIHFYFIQKKRNRFLRKIWPPSYYWYYKAWQRKAYHLAEELDNVHDFSIMHQLVMVTYREPGYLHKFDKPFVWGPIGGLENAPLGYLPALGLKAFGYYYLKNIINYWDRRFVVRKRGVFSDKKVALISATQGNSNLIKKCWGKDATVISEVGKINDYHPSFTSREKDSSLVIAWNGSHVAGKNLELLLKALALLNIPYELNIIGGGPLTSKWKRKTSKLGLKNVVWHGQVERMRAISIMDRCHVLCITSIYDLTSTVLIEGLSLGLPVICLNHMGFKNVVDDQCGIKIPVTNTKKSIFGFRSAIEHLYYNEELRIKMSQRAWEKSNAYSWNDLSLKMKNIYEDLLYEK